MNPATAKALQALSQTQTNMIQSIVSPQDAAKLPRGTIPTHIIQQQDLGDLITQAGQKLPYSLAIGFGGGSLFGAKDVQTITAKLGLTANEIPSQCFLTARGIMQTSTGGYMIMGSNPPPLRVAYDGIIKSYLLGALAFCNADIKRIPQGSGFLNQNKGRFMIPLQSIKCPAPTRQVTSLIITYNGTASTSCSYQ